MIYFDNAATTPVLPEVAEVINDVLLNYWGNPSSLHRKGYEAEKIIRESRETIAKGLRVSPKSIIFTSCGTESNNISIHSAIIEAKNRNIEKPNMVISGVEHSSVYELANYLKLDDIDVRMLPVDKYGRVNVEDIDLYVDNNTAIVCVMHVNNELGTIQPIQEIADAVKKKNSNCKVLVDGVQGFGKISIDLSKTQIDFYSASGHKIHAPKGIGLLYIKENTKVAPLMIGGGHEYGLRPGTENVAYIAGLAKAYSLMLENQNVVFPLYQHALERIAEIEGAHLVSPREESSPYIINVGFENIKSEVLMRFMEQNDMYLSSGSACSNGKLSRILQQIGVPTRYAQGCVRISFQTENTMEQVDMFFDKLSESIAQIRSLLR